MVLRFTAGEALCVSRLVNGRPDYATPFLEKGLGVPVTTRNRNTVVRLVRKHG